ncbi:GntR family transcriptional regulator [Paenibacillus athensensis]|uniref:HTH gntR-type domain-containing protein n=1 Tax=Paenibacillus athensensis TaxID=1967502 RepID=A0A4Y8PVV9_9BACL|nr:GntR family transcriptional regulator [Paenibacillus athensensis]MCD1259426.1 GntR family transcriptional regulator [Paenibacillus athensensis]
MEFNQKEPIYAQIIDDFKTKFIQGTYGLGQEIPSRREFAKQLGVNPNTVQRAYREMEEMKLIMTARGQGSCMTTDERMLESLREEALAASLDQCIGMLRSFGKSNEAILDIVRTYLERGTVHD